MKKIILFIFLSSLFFRIISINQSLWLDEATTAKVVQRFSFVDIVTKFSPFDFHPPLYYLFMKGWTNLFGFSEIALRLPSVLFSLLAGYLVYLLGRKLKNEKVGIWAALFFLFNPLIIYYSQEARMHMLTTLLLTCTLYFFLHLVSSKNNVGVISKIKDQKSKTQIKIQKYKNLFLFNLCTVLSFYTFYGAIFFIIPIFLYILYKKEYKTFLISFVIWMLSFVILLPLLYQQLTNARESLQIVVNWKNVLGTVNLKNLLLIPLKFSIGRISFNPKWAYWAISGIWTAFIWLFVIKGGLKNKFFLFLITSPLILAVLFSFFSPLLQYFRFLYLISLISLLLSIELHLKGGRVVVLTGFLLFSFIYLLFPQFHREDWKRLARSLSGKTPVYMVYSSSDPVQYYRSDLKIHDLSEIPKNKPQELIVLAYTADIHGVDPIKMLSAESYRKIEEKSFRGVTYEKWSK